MPLRRPLRAALAGPCLLLVACGDVVAPPQCTAIPTASPPHVSAGALTARADHGVMPAGNTLHVSVEAAGPLSYSAPCNQPLQLIVSDSADLHVASGGAAAPKGTPCGAVSLQAGQTAHYDVAWPSDPTLPAGEYRVVVTLGDQAPLALSVQLGAGPFITCG
jgi:hypothetical protein